MARGQITATHTSNREEIAKELFTRLVAAESEPEREQLIAELVQLHLPLCDALASRYLGRGAEPDDLVQVARTGLLLAIRRFRPEDGGWFVAFAVPTITGELKRYFRDHCWVVRPPRQVQELRARTVRAEEELEQNLGRKVTAAELGRHLGVDARRVGECFIAHGSYRPASLDAPVGAESASTLGATLAGTEDPAEQLVDQLALRRVLAGLAPRDQKVLRWRFVEECTQREIAQRLGVSQMQVSRIIRRILDQARQLLEPAPQLAG